MKAGWVYVLRSDKTPLVKVGLTTTSPAQRISEINASPNYGPYGPWHQVDIRVVRDVSETEKALHRRFRAYHSTDIPQTRELFAITPEQGREGLQSIPESALAAPVPVDNLHLEPGFLNYLLSLFKASGLQNFRNLQESWTFSLFPKTGSGRFFTLNIDRHEVGYSVQAEGGKVDHVLVVDAMVRRDKALLKWLKVHKGCLSDAHYASSWGNAVTLEFQCSFDECVSLLEMTTLRRALVAYWYDALLRMRDRGSRSLFARFHDYDATSEIYRHLEEREWFRNATILPKR